MLRPDYFPFAGDCAKITSEPGSVRAEKCPGVVGATRSVADDLRRIDMHPDSNTPTTSESDRVAEFVNQTFDWSMPNAETEFFLRALDALILAKRRSRQRESGISNRVKSDLISYAMYSKVFKSRTPGGRCVYCGISVHRDSNFSVDHIHPIRWGGRNDLTNMVGCCRRCNSCKKDLTLDEFRARRGLPAFWFDGLMSRCELHTAAINEETTR